MSVQEYNAAAITQLFNDLNTFHSELHTFGDDMHQAGITLGQAWENNESHTDFQAVYSQWNNDYAEALASLKRLAGAVEVSLHRALSADHKIGQGFSYA